MNYLASCFYGDYSRYLDVKNAISLRHGTDKLWILGDVISGNDPESSVKILNDIIEDPCVELILGDQEYAQVMLHEAEGTVYYEWEEYVKGLSPSGYGFRDYITEELDHETREGLMDYLESCEVTANFSVGKSCFYMVHGYPVFYKGDETIMEWQFGCTDTSGGQVRVDYFPWLFIKSDPDFDSKKATEENTYVILGQNSPKEAAEMCNEEFDNTGVFYKNRMFSIGRNNTKDIIPLLAVDDSFYYDRDCIGWKQKEL